MPQPHKGPRVMVTLRLSPELVARIDRRRGDTDRNKWISDAIERRALEPE